MEDLVPFLIFLVIVAINVIKFFAERGKRKPSSGEAEPQPPQPKRATSSLETFFEDLAKQMTPKPTEIPDWPEGHERPDYVQEMETFEQARTEELEEEPVAEIIPFSPPEPVARVQEREAPATVQRQATTKPMLSGSQGMRMPSMNRSGNGQRSGFRIKGRESLKRAMIAHIVFSPPRAYDLSFDQTITRR